MTRKDYLMIARAINRARQKRIPAHLMFYQIPMEITASILDEDKSFDYVEFFKICNKWALPLEPMKIDSEGKSGQTETVSYQTLMKKGVITLQEYQGFQRAYDFFNRELFAGSLPQVWVPT
jgi:hypothetical protein